MQNQITPYASGKDMWHDICTKFGADEARAICNRYLDMQIHTKDSDELDFCKELYEVMKENTLMGEDA